MSFNLRIGKKANECWDLNWASILAKQHREALPPFAVAGVQAQARNVFEQGRMPAEFGLVLENVTEGFPKSPENMLVLAPGDWTTGALNNRESRQAAPQVWSQSEQREQFVELWGRVRRPLSNRPLRSGTVGRGQLIEETRHR